LGVDYAFYVIGAPPVIVQAFLSLKRGGKAIVVGVPPFGSEVPIVCFSIPLEDKSVLGSLYGSANMRRDMPKLIDLYMRGRLKIDELVSRRIKLDDVNAAFEAMEKGEVARSVIVSSRRPPGALLLSPPDPRGPLAAIRPLGCQPQRGHQEHVLLTEEHRVVFAQLLPARQGGVRRVRGGIGQEHPGW